MSPEGLSLRGYFQESRHPFYGAMVALVMFLAYEILLVAEPFGPGGRIRNAPEAWVRFLFYSLGVAPQHLTFVMITFSLLALPWFYRGKGQVYPKVFFWLLLEAMAWGAVSGVVIHWVLGKLFFSAAPHGARVMTELGLAVGAGLFEELFFRVILTSGLIYLGVKWFKSRWVATVLAVLLASFFFSLTHYLGSLGDAFELYSFLFRFLGGLWFTSLYAARGFALVALSHACYDIFLVLT
ncbi:MAG: hypothetical protein A2600_07385 [Candidatus Lambdaproteobacteria bacterium RIFOXYD1_FULL_56_27]|uniref:CAAX prenyl protease 2/Lysostaphin resistance protein A-like domain-containing protein n=1 Tax=Candidatus Lambdaproteobacteria bacterium RIFOXYD2_FULL_56_26 TaxID=1817773 RepID=A0A1F6GVE4_9PROT|nr:MAG: hypothetical protein A2557_05360 [Candidatus Lambdaproteobacteria bacterium RIFOXYD2_FULL_56_26]OGH03752.1 MAG: hypothetical protein A2426_00835 [Candidatus Lambdaproteobacteria bacterium RIFOXYC1_FULL_56_13]OGH07336.1 MAG: hypothetical protein A2600_07385 [Candidatus Lambdaproteobacteria bacterium RIFOXYD1_FULL_56_27]